MSLGTVHQSEHLHLWAKSIDGVEFINAIYQNEIEAAINFMGIVVNVRKYDTTGIGITIEDVMQSLEKGKGIYAGYPGLVVVLSKCEGNCNSPIWN